MKLSRGDEATVTGDAKRPDQGGSTWCTILFRRASRATISNRLFGLASGRLLETHAGQPETGLHVAPLGVAVVPRREDAQ